MIYCQHGLKAKWRGSQVMVSSTWDVWNGELTWNAPTSGIVRLPSHIPLKWCLMLLRVTDILTARTQDNPSFHIEVILASSSATSVATSIKSGVWIICKFLPIPAFYNYNTALISGILMNNGKHESSCRRVCEAWVIWFPPQGLCTSCSCFLELSLLSPSRRWFRPHIKCDLLIKVFPDIQWIATFPMVFKALTAIWNYLFISSIVYCNY